MNQHDAALPPFDGPWIEIRGGKTRFPRRPITGDRLLIGSGSNCQLQLGGGMPMAHSVITRGPSGWLIEALVAEPALIVAGQPVRQATLHDGEVIQLGPFTLVAHLTAVAQDALLAPIDIEATLAETSGNFREELLARLADMPAEELVDHLATELRAAAIADQGHSAAADILHETVDAEAAVIDEEQLIADVMAQLAAMSSRLGVEPGTDGAAGEAVLPLPVRDAVSDAAPLRKSA